MTFIRSMPSYFLQAEDGIRYYKVTGVQTCALPIDRLTGNAERHSTGCMEFRRDAGLWSIVSFSGDAAHARGSEPLRAALRLLADSGFGGERSRGWGRSAQPDFVEGMLPDLVLGDSPPRPLASSPAQEPVEVT